jgi:hypothetical protein
MRHLLIITTLLLTGAAIEVHADQSQQQAEAAAKQQLLQRVYQMRMRFEQERAQADNEARANVRLITDSGRGPNRGVDSPTVTGLRQQTNQQLARFESKFECLDIDVEANSGNTVVICGDNSGDINGTNVLAERDIITVNGGQR